MRAGSVGLSVRMGLLVRAEFVCCAVVTVRRVRRLIPVLLAILECTYIRTDAPTHAHQNTTKIRQIAQLAHFNANNAKHPQYANPA